MCRKLALATTLLVLAAPVLAHAQAPAQSRTVTRTTEDAPLANNAAARAPNRVEVPLAATPNAAAAARTAAPAFEGQTSMMPAKASRAERQMMERAEPMARAAFWNAQLAVDPSDIEAALGLSRALRALGQHAQAASNAQSILVIYPDNRDAMLELAKAKIAQGEAFYAIQPLRQARELQPRDWHAVSLLGVAYEQVERFDDAWATYQEALALSPENPGILSNMGMFLAARGQAAQAEPLLRRAVAQRGATSQMRLNLAFVLGVQGKMTEAERLLREDLPPAQANNNLAYLRSISGRSAPGAAAVTPTANTRTWEALRQGG